jgi:hypothetical protein
LEFTDARAKMVVIKVQCVLLGFFWIKYAIFRAFMQCMGEFDMVFFWIKDAIFVSVRVQFDIAQGLDGYPNTMRPKKQRERLHHSLSVITMIYRSLP